MSTAPSPTGPVGVLSIRELASRRTGTGELASFTAHAREIAQASHVELLREFDQQDDPLMLWVAHREADSRGIPPCLRWGIYTCAALCDVPAGFADSNAEGSEDSLQRLFVNWLADMLWLNSREPGWRPQEAALAAMGDVAVNSADWHLRAMEVFRRGASDGVAFASMFGLPKKAQAASLTLVSVSMLQQRATLADLGELRRRVSSYARSHPDRAGVFTPEQVIDRRLLAHRLFVLAGRQHGLAAEYWGLLTGQRVSRQAFSRQLEAIDLTIGSQLRDDPNPEQPAPTPCV